MRVKRYVVKSMPDALSLIRSELGNDAVILNTKEIRVGGFMGMFRKKKMEVIAAIESGQQQAKPPTPVLAASATRYSNSLSYDADMENSSAAAVADLLKEQLKDYVQPVSPVAALPEKTVPALAVEQSELAEEIRQMKQMIIGFSRQQGPSGQRPAALQKLVERLHNQDVADEWVDRLLEGITDLEDYSTEWGAEKIWAEAERIIKMWLFPLQSEGISPTLRVLNFVGPTGVGKTTTIAKLAAEQTLRHKRRVGFITSDTYRIAAVDQLRTYANILNAPLEVVFSPLELSRAFTQLEDRSLVFVDTAGRNFRNELYVSEVNSLIQGQSDSDTFLVLSLTGKSKDLDVVARHFSLFGVEKVLFTKWDETESYGSILNIVLGHMLKPTYISSGQNVPDDIRPFEIDSYVKQLLGAAEDE
ncbi:flagellar biosynthesis protein FlhF [Paenibacillus sp. GCM10012307]|uniref:Flagellar biosynthesis protein FlhF n=1 Tax=Paenibacillus roseus TaxID=2798579 RepID=A0A934JAQ8_9BACL|nr:flagellar biosynthesis protein FlhF [Paenibacillus roseus]MBJ6363395.1 flagellar biosynthesis protein FlhF [Paenibacillus roseus]